METYDVLSLLIRLGLSFSAGYLALVLVFHYLKTRDYDQLSPIWVALFVLVLGVGTWALLILTETMYNVFVSDTAGWIWTAKTRWVSLGAEVVAGCGCLRLIYVFKKNKR